MGFLDPILNNVVVPGTAGTPPVATVAASTAVPGTAANNAIQNIGVGQIDTAFLDSLYNGGKLTPAQRDAVLAGSDPSAYGLSQYDLYALTVGRLGARTATAPAMPIILPFLANIAYAAGTFVLYTPAGATQANLYQAVQAVPAGILPTNTTYWTLLSNNTVGGAPITMYNAATQYAVGALVTYQPPGTQNIGTYQVVIAPPVGTLPTSATYWLQLTSPGAVVLFEGDVVNPALGPIASAGGTILALQTTPGAALSPLTVAASRRYIVRVFEPRPAIAGTSSPTDSNVTVKCRCAETLNADQSVSLVVTPNWWQQANGLNLPIGAVQPGTLACRVRIELI